MTRLDTVKESRLNYKQKVEDTGSKRLWQSNVSKGWSIVKRARSTLSIFIRLFLPCALSHCRWQELLNRRTEWVGEGFLSIESFRPFVLERFTRSCLERLSGRITSRKFPYITFANPLPSRSLSSSSRTGPFYNGWRMLSSLETPHFAPSILNFTFW